MSSSLIKFAVFNVKTVVNTYTALTLPFYYVYQRPWQKLRLIKSYNVKSFRDKFGRKVYYRPEPPYLSHRFYQCKTLNEVISLLDHNKPAIGVRKIINENLLLDDKGQTVKVDNKEITKIELAKEYDWLTIGEALNRIDSIGRGLQKMGVTKGEKVMIYADNSIEWFFTSLAVYRIGATLVTLFSTLGDSGLVYGLNQSECRYLVLSEALTKKIDKLRDQLKYVEKIIYIPEPEGSYKSKSPDIPAARKRLEKHYLVKSLFEVIDEGSKIPPYQFPDPKPDDYSVIMYTSGTTGNPKGVILTNDNLHQTLMNLLKYDEEFDYSMINSTLISFLPMAHLYGFLMNIGFFLSDGKIALSSPTTLFDSSPSHVPGQLGDISLIKPEFLPTVPLILERLIKEIYRKLNERSPLSAPIFTYLMEYKNRWFMRGYDTPIINRLICKKINQQFGGQLKVVGVGSAPVSEWTHALTRAALNCRVLNAYGCTEVCGGSHTSSLFDLSVGRVGFPYTNVKYYLKDWEEGNYRASDKPYPRGEIIVNGPAVGVGYYKMPEETAEFFLVDEDGTRWFATGDIGEIHEDGVLKIIDRKKDLTKIANGEFISLGKIESGLRSSKYVENICVVTNPFKNDIIALICPNKKAIEELAQKLNKTNLTWEQKCLDRDLTKHVLQSVQQYGRDSGFKIREIPVRIVLVPDEWGVDNNMLTAAFKMKRKQVHQHYKSLIEKTFEEM